MASKKSRSVKNDSPNISPTLMTSSWEFLAKSIRIALKNYEQIFILFLLPSLFYVLGLIYLESGKISLTHFHLTNHQLIGVPILGVWLIFSLINSTPSLYFRLEATRHNVAPSINECYRKGFKVFFKVLITLILSLVIIGVGLLLYIVPGVLLFRRYWLAPYYALDNPNLTIIEIFAKSAKETKFFARYIYSTAGVIILVDLVISILVSQLTNGSVIGGVLVFVLGYSVLFVPALRYQEVIWLNNKSKA